MGGGKSRNPPDQPKTNELHPIKKSRPLVDIFQSRALVPSMGWEKEWVRWEVLGVALKKVLPMDTTWVKHKCSYLILLTL